MKNPSSTQTLLRSALHAIHNEAVAVGKDGRPKRPLSAGQRRGLRVLDIALDYADAGFPSLQGKVPVLKKESLSYQRPCKTR